MTRSFQFLLPTVFALLSMLAVVAADYTITVPTASATYAATATIAIKFADDGDDPTFSDMSSTKVLLCTGPNSDIHCFSTAVGTFTPSSSLTSYSADLSDLVSEGSNGRYYFQFYSTTSSGDYSIQYSQRFTLTGMSGSYKASDGGDTSPPDGYTDVDSTPDQSQILSLNKVTYTLQSGKYRYAPMQMQPGSTVTHKLSASRRYPTSSVSYFTTYTMTAVPVTTYTPTWSYSIKQGVNWASTAASPTGYYAASEALSRSINAKSKRGYFEL